MTTAPSLTAFEWRQRVHVDRYATLLAHVIHFGPGLLDEVLRRFGLEMAEWRAIDDAWSAELVEVARRQQGLLAIRFTSTFLRARQQLAVKQPGLAMIGEPILRPIPVDDAQDAPRERLVPTYQLHEQAASAAPPRASPWIAKAASSVAAAPVEAEVPRAGPPAHLTSTATVDLQSIIRGLNLPFAKDAPPEASRPEGQRAPAPRAPSGTRQIAAMPDEPEPLPFSPKPAAELPDDPTRRFPLAVYAEIAVSLGRGEDKAALWAHHDLTEASWSVLASAWAQRIQADPQLQSQFHAHVKELKSER